jgi:hypothetical protein
MPLHERHFAFHIHTPDTSGNGDFKLLGFFGRMGF